MSEEVSPVISIIIPVYNVEKYLEECLDSVLRQSFQDFEVICVIDYGSTDNSLQILERYAQQDSRICVILQESKGVSAARNAGIRKATGEYICFLDSDDMLKPEALQFMVDEMQKGFPDMLYYAAEAIYEETLDKKKGMDYFLERKGNHPEMASGQDMLESLLRQNDFCDVVWLMVLKREWLFASGIMFNEELTTQEDTLFCIRCFFEATVIRYIPQIFYIYRIRRGSNTEYKSDFDKRLYNEGILYENIYLLAQDKNCSNELRIQLLCYLGSLANILKEYSRRMSKEQRKKFKTSSLFTEMLFQSMGIGKVQLFDTECAKKIVQFQKYIQEKERLVIYGAGYLGKQLLSYLREVNLEKKVIAFVVSDIEAQGTLCENIKVFAVENISELCRQTNVGLVLAVGEKWIDEVEENCEKYKLQNMLALTEEVQYYMDVYCNGWQTIL